VAAPAPTFPAPGVLGSLPHFRRDPLGLLMSGFETCGDVVRFRLLNRSLYLLAHPRDARRVLQDQAHTYDKGTRGFRVLRVFLRNGLLTSEGAQWLRQRRIVQPAFHRDRIAGFGDTMTAAAGQLVDGWLGASSETVNVTGDMMRLTLRIVGETLLSTDVSQEADRVGQALNTVLQGANEAIGRVVPMPAWWPSRANRTQQAAMRTLDDVMLQIIGARRTGSGTAKAKPAGEEHDLLSMLMAARDDETDEGMSDAQLRDEVMTIFLAGHETTAIALGWTWHLLGAHPEVRRRLEQVLDDALGGRPPTMADLPRLGYVEQVVKESMRLYPPAWVVSRRPMTDDVVGGFRIPAGAIVLTSPYVTHRHPEYWSNPTRFDPDRFDAAHPVDRPPFAYFPFGGGPRQCIGNSFAMMELVLVVSTIAQRCRLDSTDAYDIGQDPAITLRAAAPITMRVRRRAGAPA
jgi:cytochrome P450